MPRLLIVCLTTLFATSAQARLGENQIQHEQRYGRAAEDAKASVTQQPDCIKTYRFQGWRLVVTFRRTLAEKIEYWKSVPSDQEVAAILSAESGGGQWRALAHGHWINSNGRSVQRDSMRVTAKSAREVAREQAEEAARKRPKPAPAF